MPENNNERKLKLIWDFKGPDAARTAAHHAIHLKEFIKNNHVALDISGSEAVNPEHSIAYMVVYEGEMRPVRDALKPHRGQVYTEQI
jgi:hypothetical protein